MGGIATPYPLNNPVLGRMLQERQQQAAQPQPAPGPSSTPDAMNAPPQTVARVEHTHDIAGMGQPDTGGLAPQPIAPQKPLAKINPVQPNPAELGHQQEYNRLTGVGPNPAEGKSGISQIHNPVGRTLLQIADAVGGGLFPRIAMNIPGTQLHHNMLVRNERGALEQEQGNRAKTAAEELEAAKAEHQINTEDQQAKAAGAPHTITTAEGIMQFNPATQRFDIPVGQPLEKAESAGKTITTDQGIMQWNPETKRYDIQAGAAPGAKGGSVHQLDDGTFIMAHPDGTATPITVNGQPAKGPAKKESNVPLEEQVISEHLQKVHPGETMAQARSHTQPTPQRDPEVALDREVTHFGKTHETNVTNAQTQLEKINDARSMVSSNNAEAQALGIPKVLTALVSGQGTGVRITQPELNAIAKARGIGGDFQAFVQGLSSGKSLTPQQQQQLVGVLNDAEARIVQKRNISNDALNKINGARSRQEIIQADKEARDAMMNMEKGAGGGTVKVQIPGHPAGEIDADKLEAFKKKYPNAQVLK